MSSLLFGRSSGKQIKLNPEKAELHVLRIWSTLLLLVLNLMPTSNMPIICPPSHFPTVFKWHFDFLRKYAKEITPQETSFLLYVNILLAQGNPSPGLPFLCNNAPQIISNSIIIYGEAYNGASGSQGHGGFAAKRWPYFGTAS